MKKLKKLWVLLLIPLMVAATLTPFFSSPASAAPIDQMDTNEKIRSYLYYHALAKCFEDSDLRKGLNRDIIDPAQAAVAEYFAANIGGSIDGSTTDVAIGHYIAPSDGVVGCGDPTWIRAAVEMWGYDSNVDLLCDVGFVRDSGNCEGGSGAYKTPSGNAGGMGGEFKSAVNDKVYGGSAPVLSAEMKYALYLKTFTVGCKASQVVLVSEASNDQKAVAASDTGYTVTIATNGQTAEWIYKAELGRGKNITVASTPNYNTASETCFRLSQLISEFAPAYAAAQEAGEEPAEGPAGGVNGSGEEPEEPVCSTGDSGGWIACTIYGAATGATKTLAENFVKPLMQVDSLTDATTRTVIYDIWVRIRDIANIFLIIAFVVVIFSQATSAGISAYGIKRTMPRIVIAAILINLSFFITGIMVDITNILGAGIGNVFSNTIVGEDLDLTTGFGTNALLLVGAIGAILWVVIPMLGLIILAMLALVLTLVGRLALINILIILSPLAFAALILPNTESWFKKWRQTFVQTLMIYPIVMMLLSSGTLVAVVIQRAGDNAFFSALGLLALFFPIFLLPFVMKSFGGLVGKMQQLSQKGVNGAKGAYDNSNYGKYRKQKSQARAAQVASGSYVGAGGKFNPRNLRSGLNRQLNKNAAFNTVTGGYGAQRGLAAQVQQRKDTQEALQMFNEDDTLMKAWSQSGGDLGKAQQLGFNLSDEQKEQFQQMRQAGHHRKATSFLAVADYMSSKGKGDAATLRSSLQHAKDAGASEVEVKSALESARAQYRSSGRGDMLGEISAHEAANGGDFLGSTAASQASRVSAMAQGWNQVSSSSTHREGVRFKDANGNAVTDATAVEQQTAYRGWLTGDRNNTHQALSGYNSMEARAQEQVRDELIAAAQAHQYNETGATPTISNLQDAKDYFGVR